MSTNALAGTKPARSFKDFTAAWDKSQAIIDSVVAQHGVTLKGVTHSTPLSQETEAFSADVWVGGKKIAHAENSGRGGCTFVHRATKGCSVDSGGLAALTEALTEAIEADAGAVRMGIDGLVDRLLYTQVIQMKNRKSAVGRTKIAWEDGTAIQTVRWPALHTMWKTDPDKARAAFVAEGVKRGWFAADAVPTFINDILWGSK